MNITSKPSLPYLDNLPYNILFEGITGYLYGRLCQVNPYLTTTIFVIRLVANNLFYQLANTCFGKKSLDSHKIYLITFTLVHMFFLITLKELNLIGHFLSCVIGAGVLGSIVNHVIYIQHKERQSIINESQ